MVNDQDKSWQKKTRWAWFLKARNINTLTLFHILPEIVSKNDEILGFPFNYMPSYTKLTKFFQL